MKKKIVILLVLTSLMSQTAFADKFYYDVDTQKVEFSFETEQNTASVIVKSAANEVIYVKEIDATDGKFADEFGVPTDADSGEYELSITAGGAPLHEIYDMPSFRHINAEQAEDALEVVSGSAANNMKETLKTNAVPLGIDITVLDGANGDLVAELFYGLKPTVLDAAGFYKSYNLALILKDTKGVTDNTIIDGIIKENAAFFEIDYTEFSAYAENIKNEFYKRFCDAIITEPNNLDIVKIWLALARFNNTISWNNYKNMLLSSDYSTMLGLSSTSFNTNKAEDITRQIMNGGRYDTKMLLANAYSAACTAYAEPPGGGGGGGSSADGDSSGSSDVVIPYVPAPQINDRFSDMPSSHWAAEIVNELSQKGIVSGDDGKFNPNNSITRAEFCTLIVNAFYKNEIAKGTEFIDVRPDDWFFKYVSILADKGIVNGRGNGEFVPSAFITREDMAVIAQRCAADLGIDLIAEKEVHDFADATNFADYSKESVMTLYAAGIISGMPDGTFMPKNNLSRAEAAVVIYGIINR